MFSVIDEVVESFKVSSLTVGPRVGEAMQRSIRWLDRCIEFHEKSGKSDTQNLFAIVQGGLDAVLRDQCLDEMIKRHDKIAGYAIGGLSGGEEKGMSPAPSDGEEIYPFQIYSGECGLLAFFIVLSIHPEVEFVNVLRSSRQTVSSLFYFTKRY